MLETMSPFKELVNLTEVYLKIHKYLKQEGINKPVSAYLNEKRYLGSPKDEIEAKQIANEWALRDTLNNGTIKELELLKSIQQVEFRENILKSVKTYDYFDRLKKPKIGLIERHTPIRSLTVVYGPPKTLKSIYEMYKCLCLSHGKKFFDIWRTKKTACLYIDLENDDLIIKERWKALRKALKIRKKDAPFYYLTRENVYDILDDDFNETLKYLISYLRIGYIVIDTLPKATIYDTNSEQEVNRIYKEFLRPLIDNYNVSITFLLHTTKGGNTFLGSQAYLGMVDCSYMFKKTKKEGEVMVSSDNRGPNLEFGFKANFCFENNEIDKLRELKLSLLDYRETVEKKKKFDIIKERILVYIKKGEKVKKRNLADKVGEKSNSSTFKRVLNKLIDDGVLLNEKGVYSLK